MAYSNVMNGLSSAANTFKSVSTKLGAISNSSGDSFAIKDRILNGFLGNSSQFTPNVFARMFDEPTYLTFRVEFNLSTTLEQNIPGVSSWNLMPEPLLAYDQKMENWGAYDGTEDSSAGASSGVGYSTYSYLKNALGESHRAEMLKGFIAALKDIQENYAYYFTSIEGLGEMISVDPQSGIRVKPDKGVITIKCLEGLDLKITQLMQLYRKIAWDDVYQRWILPDMMRFFTMNIYVSEIRLFHTYSTSGDKKHGNVYDFNSSDVLKTRSVDTLSSENILNSINNVLNSASAVSANMLGDKSFISKAIDYTDSTASTIDTVINSIRGNNNLCDNAINDVMPTMCFECHLCEFDISNTLSHLGSLSSSSRDKSDVQPALKIKVGNIKEKMVFPLQNGLSKNEINHKYKISDALLPKFIDDEQLKREATYRISSPTDYFKKLDYEPITSKWYRVNKSYSKSDKPDDSIVEYYDPFSPDKRDAVISLFTGLAGVLFTDLYSTAIDGEAAQRVKREIINNKYDPVEVLSAATSLKQTIDYAMETIDTTSKATSPEEQEKLRNTVLIELLDNLNFSTATKESNEIKMLYDLIEESITETGSSNTKKKPSFSKATIKRDDLKGHKISDGFSFLN